VCECYPGFGASDGMGGPGPIEDCGWRVPFPAAGDWQADAPREAAAAERSWKRRAALSRAGAADGLDGGRGFAEDAGRPFSPRAGGREGDERQLPRGRTDGRSVRGGAGGGGPWANPWEYNQQAAWREHAGRSGPAPGRPYRGVGADDRRVGEDGRDGWQRVNGGWWRPRLDD